MTDEENKIKSNNIKIAITAILSVLLCAAFILALVNFGMGVQQKIDDREAGKKEAAKVYSIIAVDYEATDFAYNTSASEAIEEESGSQPKNYLINSIDETRDEAYLVINNKDLLNKAVDGIKTNSGSNISYGVDDDFFKSGSVVLITTENIGTNGFKVSSVTRDDEYNIQIDAKYSVDNTSDTKAGRAIFVKIPNIQPTSIKLNISKE